MKNFERGIDAWIGHNFHDHFLNQASDIFATKIPTPVKDEASVGNSPSSEGQIHFGRGGGGRKSEHSAWNWDWKYISYKDKKMF